MTGYYVPGTEEKDPAKVIMSLQQAHSNTATNTTNIATNTANIATNTAAIAAMRQPISAARTYYVRADGSDSNTGLANTAGGAFLTIQKAVDITCTIDMSIYQVTVQVGNGTYTGGVSFKNWTGSLPPIILGDTTTPSNVLVHPTSADCFLNDGAFPWHVRGFQLRSTTSGSQLRGKAGGTIYFRNCDFGASAGNHIWFEGGAKVIADGNYSISGAPGGDGIHALASDLGSMKCNGITVTVTGTPAWVGAYASATRNGVIRADAMTFVGSATGPRRAVNRGGVVYTAGGGDSYFPGDSTGTGTNSATSPYGDYF